jgi:hypothetical protein
MLSVTYDGLPIASVDSVPFKGWQLWDFKVRQMLKIRRAANGEVVFTVSGCMDAENILELRSLLQSEAKGRRITLDLRDLTLVDQAAVSFLECCEADGVRLENCPAYIREWIARERRGS